MIYEALVLPQNIPGKLCNISGTIDADQELINLGDIIISIDATTKWLKADINYDNDFFLTLKGDAQPLEKLNGSPGANKNFIAPFYHDDDENPKKTTFHMATDYEAPNFNDDNNAGTIIGANLNLRFMTMKTKDSVDYLDLLYDLRLIALLQFTDNNYTTLHPLSSCYIEPRYSEIGRQNFTTKIR